ASILRITLPTFRALLYSAPRVEKRRTGMPGFRNHLYLYSCAAHRAGTQTEGHFAEETSAKISRAGQFILQNLLDKLLWVE
ncbi:hypothetical protein, partial [Thiomonas arsenitoxydans]|uniref:hypothetical protein n=1 Tax=Thiomonas arsenitoxydans (strain DSM 22701 / CIP 110005 / 3As) TaxID=426114 RepID=UPI001AD05483